jgi:hypothetical protein
MKNFIIIIIGIFALTLDMNAQEPSKTPDESVYMENMILSNPIYDCELFLPEMVVGPFHESFKVEEMGIYIQVITVTENRRGKNTLEVRVFDKKGTIPVYQRKFTFKELEKPFHREKKFLDMEIGKGLWIKHPKGDDPYIKGEHFIIGGECFSIEYHVGNLMLNTHSSLEGYLIPEKYVYSHFHSDGCTVSRVEP